MGAAGGGSSGCADDVPGEGSAVCAKALGAMDHAARTAGDGRAASWSASLCAPADGRRMIVVPNPLLRLAGRLLQRKHTLESSRRSTRKPRPGEGARPGGASLAKESRPDATRPDRG